MNGKVLLSSQDPDPVQVSTLGDEAGGETQAFFKAERPMDHVGPNSEQSC